MTTPAPILRAPAGLPVIVAFMALAAPLPVPEALQAQVLRGTVVDRESGVPVPMALLVVLDEDDATVGRVLTDQTGRFIHRLSGPGVYRVRVERIGLRSETSDPVTVAAGTTASVHLRVGQDPIELPGLVVQGEERCRTPGEEGALIADLWDEARKALGMAVATEEQLGLHIRTRNHERTRDIATMEVLDQRFRSWSGITRTPYMAEPPDALADEGYVRREEDGYRYFGLAAETILSRTFEETHCFRVRGPAADQDADEIGLAFEPVRGRRTPDVSGVLWLDRETAELRRVEYGYTDHLQPVRLPEDVFGGMTEFRKLPDGGWIVDRWWIRMPQSEHVIESDHLPRGTRARGAVRSDADARRDFRRVGISVLEVGGTVLSVGSTARPVIGTGVIQGEVYDSISGEALIDAEIFVLGTSVRTRTDRAGTFRLPRLAPGTWQVGFQHDRLDDLGFAPEPVEVELLRDGAAEVRLAVPPAVTVLGGRCPRDAGADDEGEPLFGFVRDGSGQPLAGIRIVAEWREWSHREVDQERLEFRADATTAGAVTDLAGAWVICDLPAGAVVEVRAFPIDGERPQETEVRVRAGEGGRADFTVRRR